MLSGLSDIQKIRFSEKGGILRAAGEPFKSFITINSLEAFAD